PAPPRRESGSGWLPCPRRGREPDAGTGPSAHAWFACSGTPLERQWLERRLIGEAGLRQPRRQHHLGVVDLEEEGPVAVVAVHADPAAQVAGQELVLAAAELRVAGHDPRALEAHPLVAPDA